MSGKLFVVATPIGNLEDMSPRAVRVLREADLIAAEDTRHTGHLLARFEVRKPLVSYHQFSEAKRTAEFLRQFEEGKIIALVSDAGLPGVSDPGERLIRAAVAAGVPVEVVPGPSAPLLFRRFSPGQKRPATQGTARRRGPRLHQHLLRVALPGGPVARGRGRRDSAGAVLPRARTDEEVRGIPARRSRGIVGAFPKPRAARRILPRYCADGGQATRKP